MGGVAGECRAGGGGGKARQRPGGEQGHAEGSRGGMEMARDERGFGRQQLDHLGRARGLGGAAEVDDGRVRGDGGARAEGAGAEAEVGFLAVHEEGRVEAAELGPESALDQQEAARDDVDLAHAVARPAAVGFAVEGLGIAEDGGEAGRTAEQIPRRHAAPARCRVETAVGEQCPAAPDARRGPGEGERVQPLDGAVEHDGVGVEQQQEAAARGPGGEIVGACEAEVGGRGDETDAGEGFGDGGGGAVGRGVVDDDDLGRKARGLRNGGRECGERQRARVVTDDQDRDVDRMLAAHRLVAVSVGADTKRAPRKTSPNLAPSG